MFRFLFAFILEANPGKEKPQNMVCSRPGQNYYWAAFDMPGMVIRLAH